MSNFNDLFDQWAPHYDQTVFGTNNEYAEVFENYTAILTEISRQIGPGQSVLEIGVGTGNLTQLLVKQGLNVVGIEPSLQMRSLARAKLPQVPILEGHFLSVPSNERFDAIVTSYALHHLTLPEKRKAFKYLKGFLREKGKLIIADTMFESIDYKNQLLKKVEAYGYQQLLVDLNSEYYELVEDLTDLLAELQFSYDKKQMNTFVWMITAEIL